MASLDLRRAFDKIEHESFFGALRAQGLPNVYIDLLRALYRNQSGVVEGVEGSDPFNNQRGIKQGDVLSPALSCTIQFWFGTSCVLLENESHNFTTNGVDVGGNERLTNARYADDLLLYATTLPELVYMIPILCEKLAQVGLHLNESKTKFLTTCADCVPEFVSINGETLDVLASGAAPKYLGRKYTGDLSKRGHIGFQRLLTNKHISIKLRLRLFDSIISPTILIGLLTMPLTQSELTRLDVVQKKMLRSMVGWVRTPDEDWCDTMARMRDKVNNALGCYHVDNWTKQLAIRQHNFAAKLARQPGWRRTILAWCPQSNWQNNFGKSPKRKPGRPLKKWQEKLSKFCERDFVQFGQWVEAARSREWFPPRVVQSFCHFYVNS